MRAISGVSLGRGIGLIKRDHWCRHKTLFCIHDVRHKLLLGQFHGYVAPTNVHSIHAV